MFRSVLVSFFVLVLGADATAAPRQYFTPRTVDFGGGPSEVYVPVVYDGPARTTPAGIADAALKALVGQLIEAADVQVSYKGNVAQVTITADKSGDANVSDRAFGAVYYTLQSSGFSDVRLDGNAVTAAYFSRGAFVPVMPLPAVMPPNQVASGLVKVGDKFVSASAFYAKLKAGDKDVLKEAKSILETGSTAAKLSLLQVFHELRFAKKRDAVVTQLLKDSSAKVQLMALDLLKGYKSKKVLSALAGAVSQNNDSSVQLAAARLLVAAGKKDYEKYLLLDKLGDADASVVISAVTGLVNAADPAFAPPIAALASHNSPQVRAAAIKGLTELKHYRLMADWLDDEALSAGHKEAAGLVLAKTATGTNRARGISYLVLLGGPEAAIEAANIVQKERVPGTTTALAKALTRGEANVRAECATALGALKDAAGLGPLAAGVQKTTDPKEREHFTTQATAIISVQPLAQVIAISRSTDLTIRELAIKSLASFSKDRANPKAIAELEKSLTASEPTIRQAAAYALARIKDEGVTKTLIGLTGDKDAMIRAQVAYSVARSKQADADARLLKFLDDREAAVKVAAIEGLRLRGNAESVVKIQRLVNHRNGDVKREALATVVKLAKAGDPALFDVYVRAVQDRDADLRQLGLEGLAAFVGDKRADRAVGTVIADDQASSGLKLKAISLLGGSREPDAVEQVVRGLFAVDKAVKMATLDALAKMGSEKALRPLQEFVAGESDPTIRGKAEKVLEEL